MSPSSASTGQKVLLGQVGFFDQFTFTFSRTTLQLAIEGAERFDDRFGAG
ncbi:MAG TPA: hypothetical protein VF512_10765 [Actinomycetota bacterium]